MNANSTGDRTELAEISVPTEDLGGDNGQRENFIHKQVDPQTFGTATKRTKNSHLTETRSYVLFLSFR